MTIHILVEGPSEQAFLDRWGKRLLKAVPFRVHPHQGKGELPKDPSKKPDPRHRGLLDQLPAKLRAFAGSLNPKVDGVLVLVDADTDDPRALADRIRDDGGENKVAWAEAMGPAVTTKSAESRSFRDLVAALLRLGPPPREKARRKRYRHPPKRKAGTSGRR